MSDAGIGLALSKLLPALLSPLGVSLLLLALATFLRAAPGRRRMLSGTALAILLFASCAPVARELGKSLEWANLPSPPTANADAIVLLGGATRPAIPPRSEPELDAGGNRVLSAARLYKAGKAPYIHVAGGRLDWTGKLGPESEDIAQLLGELGVPRDALSLDSRSRNTEENAVVAREMLLPRGVHKILLVTSALHMPRARRMFEAEGFEVFPAPTDFHIVELGPLSDTPGQAFRALLLAVPNADSLAFTSRAFREMMGLAYYRVRELLR